MPNLNKKLLISSKGGIIYSKAMLELWVTDYTIIVQIADIHV
jgi:hypothetical protein